MSEFLARAWEQLVGRLDGPMWFRFLLQPAMALLLAVRAGIADARADHQPYLWRLVKSRGDRRRLLTDAWMDVGTVFVVALVVDAIYQLAVLGFVYPLQTVIVAITLAFVPYVLMRGPIARLARHFLAGR
jgi:hypothetical protein